MTDDRCAFCGAAGVRTTTTSMERGLDGVDVTVTGIPATYCPTCGDTGIHARYSAPIDAAITDILVAAGVASRPTPEEEAALRAENRALTRALGQGDTLLDDPADASTGEPSGASTAR